jgi:hypothetical protein
MIEHLTEYAAVSRSKIIELNEVVEQVRSAPYLIPSYRYCGESLLGKRSGLGFMVTTKEKTYIGSWLNGMRHGYGIFTTEYFRYVGEFFEDEMHGDCLVYSTRDGDKCSGSFRHNVMHGYGKKTKGNSKWSYEGEWSNDQRHGKGTFTSACGTEVYVGEFLFNSMKGEGVLTDANKETFTGMFRKGKCDGKAVWRNQFGSVLYDGLFVDGQKHGHGVETALDGIYTGDFKRDLRSGQGVLEYSNGDVYNGVFDKNCATGKGEKVTADGKVFTGVFLDGMLVMMQ